MRTKLFVILLMIPFCGALYSQEHRYHTQDFYHRSITVPIDHFGRDEGTFSLYYELSPNFRFDQPTICFLSDQQQSYGSPGNLTSLIDDEARGLSPADEKFFFQVWPWIGGTRKCANIHELRGVETGLNEVR